MIALLLALAQWVSAPDPQNPNRVLSGNWQSCRDDEGVYTERIYDGPGWEFHMGPGDEFAVFLGRQEAHREHASKANLLGPAYHASDVVTWRGKRNWNLPSLKLWVNVVQAGGGRSDCESFWVLVEKRDG